MVSFTDPITLCRDITSYNVARSWSIAMFKYIKVTSMTGNFSRLPKALNPRTLPPDIFNLVEDTDPASYMARGTNFTPLTANG